MLLQEEERTLKDEDERLAEVWLAHFGTPMPLRGAPAVTRRILLDSGAREALRLSDVASAEAPGCKNTPAIRSSGRRP